ncbi:MAG: cation-translocating P-type ATPase C-terminal domain-containing protein [Flavobacteriales bacterium]
MKKQIITAALLLTATMFITSCESNNSETKTEKLATEESATAQYQCPMICTLGAVFISHFFFHTGKHFDPKLCNNILFFTLIFCQLFHVFNMASVKTSFTQSEVFRNKYVWYALLSSGIILLSVFFIPPAREALNVQPLKVEDWLVVVASAALSLLAIQILKRTNLIHDED